MPTPPATTNAPVSELVDVVVFVMNSGPPNVDRPDVAMPPCTTSAPVVVLVDVAVKPLRTTAPFLTMKSACATQFPFPLDGFEFLVFIKSLLPYAKL